MLFRAAGSCISSVEMYDIRRNEWAVLDGLPGFGAGCVGFMVGNECWVMSGYGESQTILGVFPVDEHYRNAVVMQLKNGGVGKSGELGEMWDSLKELQLLRMLMEVFPEFSCLIRITYSGMTSIGGRKLHYQKEP